MIKTSPVRTNQISGLQTLASIFLMIFLFVATHEVSIEDSVKLCATLLLDVVTGGLLWVLLSKKFECSVFEFFGVGVALGTSINTVAQLSLRTTAFGSMFNIYFGLLVIALFILRRNKKLTKLTITKTEPILLFGLLTISLAMICGDRYYIWLGAIILGLSYFLFQKTCEKKGFPSSNSIFAFLFICVAISIALFASSILENILFGPRTTISYIGGWDGFVIEANRKSIMNFGPFDNILLSNTKYAYYWFHDAWSGSFTQRARVGDWIVTTQFGFIVSALASLSLLVDIIIKHVNRNTHVILVLWLVASLSLIGSPSNILYLGNLSQVIAILWICWILFLLNEYANSRETLQLWLLIFAGTLLVMTKITAAVPVIGGVLFVACLSVIANRKRVNFFKMTFFSLLITVTSLLAYTIFIKPAPAQRANYTNFSFKINNTVFGISSGFILVDLLVVVAPIFAVASLLYRVKQKPELLEVLFCSISALSLIFSTSTKFNAQLFLTITLVASMSGSFVAHSLRSPLKQFIFSQNNWDSESQNTELKYSQLIPALRFVEVNSSSFDVIASNSTTDQGLIAAVTGVRNFATSYLPNFWGGVSDRYIHQSTFGRDGSFADYEFLRQGCVTWFYFDKTEPEMYERIWEPYAKIQYEDEFGAVLKMSNLVKLSSKC